MAGNDLNYLARQMDRYADKVESNSDQMVRQVTRNLGPALGYSTPVLTSRARANWQAAINTRPTSILYPEPSTPPSPQSGAGMAVQSCYNAAMAYRHGATVYVVNNVPYIRRLNGGSSSQAPAGFVQIAVNVAIRTIQGVRLLR